MNKHGLLEILDEAKAEKDAAKKERVTFSVYVKKDLVDEVRDLLGPKISLSRIIEKMFRALIEDAKSA